MKQTPSDNEKISQGPPKKKNASEFLERRLRNVEARGCNFNIWIPIKMQILIIALLGGFMFGCQAPMAPLPEQMAAAPRAVTLVPGDVVKLTFSGAPELNQSQKIRTDGKLNLPLIGEVDAAGKTIASLQNELTFRYKPQLQNATVVVTLESSMTQVVVSGAVTKPAKLSFDRPTTVFQAIMEAGGVNEYGSLGRVYLIRLANGEQHTQALDLRSTIGGKPTRALYVRDGDVIYVPRSMF